MIEATAIGPADIATALDAEETDPATHAAPARWTLDTADLRFFVTCYLAGLIVFLVMLS